MELDWKGIIPSYLKYINDFYKNQFNNNQKNLNIKNGKVHILFVEGKTDQEFYKDVLNFDFKYSNEKKYNLNLDRKYIYYDLSKPFESEEHKPDQMHNRDNTDTKNDNPKKNGILKYEFVIECIKKFNEMKDKLKYIDCYGIVDRDFGHDETNNMNNIAISKFHDIETTTLRYYLPNFFNTLKEKTKAVKIFTEIIDMCFKQGIIEEQSHKFEIKENCTEKNIRKVTRLYFKDHQNTKDLRKSNFDFEDYLLNYDKFEKKFNWDKTKYDNFFELAKNKISIIYKFEGRLFNIFRRWLILNKTKEEDEEIIDSIFEYCNGHLILNQMCFCGKLEFGLLEEKDFEDFLINKLFPSLEPNLKIFKELPLKDYIEYRIDNGFYESSI